MMIVAPNSLVRQEEGAQGKEEEQAGGRRRVGLIGTPTPGAEAPTGLSRLGALDARNRRRDGRRYGVPLHKKSRGG